MTLPRKRLTDEELETTAKIAKADHVYVTPSYIRKLERKLLGPSWGKKRREFRPR